MLSALALALLSAAPAAAGDSPVLEARPFGRIFFRPELGLNLHDFDSDASDTDFIFTLRTNTGLDTRLPHDVHVVFDLQSYGTYALNAGPLDPSVNLYQGYVELVDMGNTPLDLLVGRFEEASYGTGMLVAPDSFYDGFSLEGLRLRYNTDRATLDLVWSQLYAFDSTAGEEDAFWRNPVLFGTNDTVHINRALSFDGYLWWMVAKPFSGWVTMTYTLGGRVFGEAGEAVILDYSVEGTWQTGTAKGILDASAKGTISAYALDPRVGATIGPVRVGLEYYRASGDADTSDDVIRSFNTMWQDPHGRFGNLDRYTGSNLQAGILSVDARLAGGDLASHLGANATTLSVLEPGDSNAKVFQDGSTPPADASTALGLGGDLWYKVPITQEVGWQINLSAMQPGALIEDTLGKADLQFRGYTAIEAQF